ncbi:hypothetical protein HYV79_02765 [Candidatus Woesearchaeota archaeon]|nr:hypothetical protein [Candidatus Woesearchaeota archaeon]
MKLKDYEDYISLCKQLIQVVPESKKKDVEISLETLIYCYEKTKKIETLNKKLLIKSAEIYANYPNFDLEAYEKISTEDHIKDVEKKIECFENLAKSSNLNDIEELINHYKKTLKKLKKIKEREEETQKLEKENEKHRKIMYTKLLEKGFSEENAKKIFILIQKIQ